MYQIKPDHPFYPTYHAEALRALRASKSMFLDDNDKPQRKGVEVGEITLFPLDGDYPDAPAKASWLVNIYLTKGDDMELVWGYADLESKMVPIPPQDHIAAHYTPRLTRYLAHGEL